MNEETIHDPLLGPLSWDSEQSLWCGQGSISSGDSFELFIDTGVFGMQHPFEDSDVSRVIPPLARDAFSRLDVFVQQGREALAKEYIPIYVKWHNESIPAASFQKRLRLESVRLMSTGSVEIAYGDDEMFHGHGLIVYLNPQGSFEYAEMFG